MRLLQLANHSIFYFLKTLRRLRKKFPLFLLTIFFFTPAFAGSVSGPNVVWVNLDSSSEGEKINKIIANFVDNKLTRCHGNWFPGTSLIYMKRRPPKISDALIKNIFLNARNDQKRILNSALKNYSDEYAYDGFDGIIVYENSTRARMMRLTTGRRKIETFTLSKNGEKPERQDIEAAFCVLLPPITRAP